MDENNIRLPDQAIYDKLVEADEISDFDKEMEEAIKKSMKEFIEEDLINRQYEEELIKRYEKILFERKEQCREILIDIARLTLYDKEMKEIYEIIDPILECYCAQNIDFYEIDTKTYNRIYYLLSKIRTKPKNIEFLKTIILPSTLS